MRYIKRRTINSQIKIYGSVMILMVLMITCYHRYKYSRGFLPTSPVNLKDFNTKYDDYNMTSPTFGTTFPVLFSSNRNSFGAQYDIIYEIFDIWFDRDDGTITSGREIHHYTPGDKFLILKMVLPTINTSYNELGPYVIDYSFLCSDIYNDKYYGKYLFMYANDPSGNLDIMYTLNYEPGNETSTTFIDPKPLIFLNSDYNEAYPCIDLDLNRIYYCTDQNGDFDIYFCQLATDKYISDEIQDTLVDPTLIRSDILSSEGDDKCPYITSNIIVFTSNREGGFGGYDLWYAQKDSTDWSIPINFGEKINTEYDEYRPVLIPMYEFKHDLLMFSSNRPGGQGGFDLYWVGVKTLIEYPYY
jgi:hypothetical protein